MLRLRHKLFIRLFRLLDQLVLWATLAAVVHLRPERLAAGRSSDLDFLKEAQFYLKDAFGLAVLLFSWILIFSTTIRYREGRFSGFKQLFYSLLKATTASSFVLLIVSVIFSFERLTIFNILAFWIVVNFLGVLSRLFFRYILTSARKSGKNYRYLLVIGADKRALNFASGIVARKELGYKVVGFVAENEKVAQSWNEREWELKGQISDLKSILKKERVDELMVCVSLDSTFSDIMTVIQTANDLGIVARILPGLEQGSLFKKMNIENFEGESMVTLFREQLILQLLLKRMLDISVSLLALILLSPVLLIVAICIKLTDKGKVFFAQDRVGMNQRRFKMYKFRSMVANAEELKNELQHLNEQDGPAFKIKDDPRITKIGRFIRKTSIDELPQLFNVLSGEMSLVGPRPPLPQEVEGYEWKFRKRLSIKPGITCIWQVEGRNTTTFERWMEMDRHYIDNWSIFLDIKILLLTIPAVLFGRGAS